MFGYCFLPLFFVFKNNFFFIFETKKICLAIQNEQKTKTVIKTQFVKEIENMQNIVFQLLIFKSQ